MDKYALLGYPLSHSYSPLIHNEMFKQKNINATYELLEIKEDKLEDAIESLKNGTYKGFNVTIPYKVKIIDYVDELTDHAKSIGSVNTLYLRDGKVVGDNTDYYGFIEELKYYNINPKGMNVYILGTGGASLAVNKALIDMGANTIFVSRTKKNNTITYSELNELSDIDMIVNTTPVGMYPNVSLSPIDEETALKAKVIVDIIFNPSTTKLMSYNKNSYNGLLMLLYQADKAEDIWLNKSFKIDENRVLNKIRGELYE